MTVLIVVGSRSDVDAMRKAVDELFRNKTEYEFRVCSAHRTPDMLDRIIKGKDYDCIIAGAGLAAALPGTVAAKTLAPVIGVPLAGAFEGLDALLSTAQMPPGIPVLCTGVNNAEEAAKAAIRILGCKAKKVNIIAAKNTGAKAVGKATEMLNAFGISHETGNEEKEDAVNIRFVGINEKNIPNISSLTICCPTAENETAADTIKLLQLTEQGLWVGLNRGENAAIAAAEIMKRKKELADYREVMRKKVEEADSEVYGKL